MSCFPLLSLINSVILWKQTNNPLLISQFNSNILIGGISIYMYVLSFGFFLTLLNLYVNVIVSLSLSLLIYNYPVFIILKKINKLDNSDSTNEHIIITEV